MFDTLVNSLNQFSKIPPRAKTEGASSEEHSRPELAGLIVQIQDARQQLVQCDPVNYAEVIAWIAGQARVAICCQINTQILSTIAMYYR
jgi:hypothetical protein